MIAVNKRLDEWVREDRMDMRKLEGPKQKDTKTPMKMMNGSRPSSPERDMVRNLWLYIALVAWNH